MNRFRPGLPPVPTPTTSTSRGPGVPPVSTTTTTTSRRPGVPRSDQDVPDVLEYRRDDATSSVHLRTALHPGLGLVRPQGAPEGCFRPSSPVVSTFHALLITLSLLGLTACNRPEAPADFETSEAPASTSPTPEAATELLRDVTTEAGLDFVHHAGFTGELHMAELLGAGAALFDGDGDGDLDLYLIQGGSLPPSPDDPHQDRVYRNDTPDGGPLRFVDVTDSATTPIGGYGMGVATGDVDGDGDLDLYITRYGTDRLLLNRAETGSIRLDDVTVAAGLDAPADGVADRWSVPATFFDADGDGDLDLFVGHYLDLPVDHDPASAPRCTATHGGRDYCGAAVFPGVRDRLWLQVGTTSDGLPRFRDATAETGLDAVADEAGRALGAVAVDFDRDGRQDLLVANDDGPNNLWHQQPDGRFVDTALLAGVAVNRQGQTEASMGVGVDDLDGDGDLDVLLTHLVVETHTLYRQRGPMLFDDVTDAAGLGGASRSHTGFGTAFVDFDGDGWRDLFVANGAVQSIASLATAGDPMPYHETNQVFRHPGRGFTDVPRFVDVSATSGPVFAVSEISRGVAVGDLDNDGDRDLIVTQNGGPARILLSSAADGRRWLGVRALDRGSDAIGAIVTLDSDGGADGFRSRVARIATDGSYASASDPRAVFVLAEGERALRLRVRWPGSTSVEEFSAPPVGAYTPIHRGGGAPSDSTPTDPPTPDPAT